MNTKVIELGRMIFEAKLPGRDSLLMLALLGDITGMDVIHMVIKEPDGNNDQGD